MSSVVMGNVGPTYRMLLDRKENGEILDISMCDRNLLFTLRNEGAFVWQIAELFGVSKGTMQKRISKLKVNTWDMLTYNFCKALGDNPDMLNIDDANVKKDLSNQAKTLASMGW